MRQKRLAWFTLAVLCVLPAAYTISAEPASGTKAPEPLEGKYEHGELVTLEVGGRRAYIIRPTGKVDGEKRWIWTAPYWLSVKDTHGNVQHRDYIDQFLQAGMHMVGIDVGTSCGSPRGAETYQKFYELLTTKYGLNKKARLLGQSNGGLISYGWAFRHPECVDRIAGICPVTDFRSWPTLSNVINYPDPDMGYGLSLEELTKRTKEFNPVDNMAPLVKARVKIFHVHGDRDELVPMALNSVPVIEQFKAGGVPAELEVIPGLGHGGQELYHSKRLVEFLLE